MAFSYPYLLTATGSVLVSLYTFDVAPTARVDATAAAQTNRDPLPAPVLLTSPNPHTSRPPLALSIRKLAETTVASIAYTFTTRQGWSIGVQDLHICSSAISKKSIPEITATRIAYTAPVDTAGTATHAAPPLPTVRRRQLGRSGASSPNVRYLMLAGPRLMTIMAGLNVSLFL